MKNKWFRSLLKKRFFMIILILLQLFFMIYAILSTSVTFKTMNIIFRLLSLVVCVEIVYRNDNGAFKLSWVFLILLFPVFGGLMYLFFKFQSSTKRFSKRIRQTKIKTEQPKWQNKNLYMEAANKYPSHQKLISYLEKGSFPVYSNTKTRYLCPGEEKLEALLEQLEKAEKYIFLEYFIIKEGDGWGRILEILMKKAALGVLVRVMYDDMGCFIQLPKDYPKRLEKMGIECTVFNPFKPILTSVQNNRDHRKIAIIDGEVAFTGGINLADYYFNSYPKYGHWKDSSVMLQGDGAWGLTLMFLQMWELCTGVDEDYSLYYPSNKINKYNDGFVQPYCDSPVDKENTGENVYLHIINNAKKYVYINTPYLIIDEKMLSALCLAAKSGVDVRITTPYIWDKWAIHMTTRSYYKDLILSGVKIYEYTPGFIHAKTFVSDDTVGVVGSTNLDFRSLYLHFECGVVMYGSHAVTQLKQDYLSTLQISKMITEEDCKCGFFMKLFRNIMRLIAPLL